MKRPSAACTARFSTPIPSAVIIPIGLESPLGIASTKRPATGTGGSPVRTRPVTVPDPLARSVRVTASPSGLSSFCEADAKPAWEAVTS